ncbi:ABC transporter permease [Acidobacterium sp. S8]|uniref:ABC transporter permease n=1 Tax=Acidobacterium sp. S8 TaxID=1641854 RepID=UPI00131E1F10|nr:ABC transporter permease [Acidobacterium sp. S8]
MLNLWNDLRYALRQLRKSPGFALTAVLTLALGIGVNAAIFTIFNKVLLHTMPVQKPGELVLLQDHSQYETGSISTQGGDNHLYFSYSTYRYLHDNNRVLSDLAADVPASANLVSTRDADHVNIDLVTGNYFNVMQLQPVLGRLLAPSDDVYHAGNPVAVMSEDYWKSKFGSDPNILNQTVKISGTLFTVVGVVRHSGLLDSTQPAIFLPLSLEQAVIPGGGDRLSDPLYSWALLVGRLRQGITRAQAETQLNTAWWNWRRDTLQTESHKIGDKSGWLRTHLSLISGSRGVPVLEQTLGEPLKSLEAMAIVVLLIACVNVANLLLVKAARKHAELAVRGALGASRKRIFQQVVAEGLLLGLMGAISGLVLGWLSLELVVKSIPQTNYLHDLLNAPMDWKVAAFCIFAGIATSLVFSIAPALMSTRVNLMRALHGQSGSVAGSGNWLRNLFVGAETALSLVLLMGAAILSWSLYQLHQINPGFSTSHVLTFRIDASALGKNDTQVREEYETLTSKILHEPGVQRVVYAGNGLMTGNESGSNVTVAGYKDTRDEPVPDNDNASAGFFSTMQIPLLAGREFNAQDTLTSPKVAIVDEKFVKHYFGGDAQKALRGQFGFGSGDVKTDIQIVGVIPTISAIRLSDPTSQPFIYLPYAQSFSKDGSAKGSHPANFYVRTSGDPAALAGTLHPLLHRLDPDLPMPDFETMNEHINGTIFETKLMALLASSMGALALALAAIGLYGVLAFAVAQRTREIGIRMALGAGKSNISTLVLRQVSLVVTGGLFAGALLGWGAIRLLIGKTENVHTAPLWVHLLTAFVLVAAMFLASYLPARRAASVDPMEALRAE